jgi:hypothetical protein
MQNTAHPNKEAAIDKYMQTVTEIDCIYLYSYLLQGVKRYLAGNLEDNRCAKIGPLAHHLVA